MSDSHPGRVQSSWWRIGALLCWLATVISLLYLGLMILITGVAVLAWLLSGGAGPRSSGGPVSLRFVLLHLCLPPVLAIVLLLVGRWMHRRAPGGKDEG